MAQIKLTPNLCSFLMWATLNFAYKWSTFLIWVTHCMESVRIAIATATTFLNKSGTSIRYALVASKYSAHQITSHYIFTQDFSMFKLNTIWLSQICQLHQKFVTFVWKLKRSSHQKGAQIWCEIDVSHTISRFLMWILLWVRYLLIIEERKIELATGADWNKEWQKKKLTYKILFRIINNVANNA